MDGGVNRWCEFAANAQICVAQDALARAYFVGPKNKDKEIRTKQDEICLPQKYRAVN